MLVETMRGDGLCRATQTWADRLDHHFVGPHIADDHAVRGPLVSRRAAFDNLARVPGGPMRQAHLDRHSRMERRIAASPSHNEFDASGERRLECRSSVFNGV